MLTTCRLCCCLVLACLVAAAGRQRAEGEPDSFWVNGCHRKTSRPAKTASPFSRKTAGRKTAAPPTGAPLTSDCQGGRCRDH